MRKQIPILIAMKIIIFFLIILINFPEPVSLISGVVR